MLHPVPARPPGPVDPAEAALHVAAVLPGLDPPAATALALVALAGLDRPEVAGRLEMESEQLATALALARKRLRREAFPLPGSGWCERAERMISDRLDDALADPGPARLKAHLANCSRCVEHERRLVTVQDGLVASFDEAHPAPAPVAAALTVVDPPAKASLPEAEPVEAEPVEAEPVEAEPVEAEPVEAEPVQAEPVQAVPVPVVPVRDSEPSEPVEVQPAFLTQPAPALPAPRTAAALAGGLAWGALAVLAMLLTLTSIGLAVAGILGAG